MRVGLVFDLRDDYLAEGYTEEETAEFDSKITIDSLDGALTRLGYATERIGHGRALAARLARGDRWDIVFSIAEGISGRSREAQAPCLLEMFGVPYVFSDPLVCAVTLDKGVTKRIVGSAGLNTPAFAVVASIEDARGLDLAYPLFAKPIAEGTGKGVDERSRCDSPDQLRDVCAALLERFRQPVLVEEYLPGREFTTAILGTGSRARVLGTTEVILRADAPTRDYSYAMKDEWERYVEYRPIEAGALKERVERLALASYRLLECRDTGRIDLRIDRRGEPAFVEINPLPGLRPDYSDLPIIATQQGMSYTGLIDAIMESAIERIDGKKAR